MWRVYIRFPPVVLLIKELVKKNLISYDFSFFFSLSDEKVRQIVKALLTQKPAPDTKEVKLEKDEKEDATPEQYKSNAILELQLL